MVQTIFKACIENIAAGGAGLAQVDGKKVFIEGVVPGETILCRISEEHRSWLKADLLEVTGSSPERVQPACSCYGICGGCNLQHISYDGQIKAKAAILSDTFSRIGGIDLPEQAATVSEPWEYRNRMQFHVIRSGGKHKADGFWGLKGRKSAETVPVRDCPIADPAIRSLLQNKAAVAIPPEKDRFNIYARNGLVLNEGGTGRGKTPVLNKQLTLDAGVFFQSNGSMLEKLVLALLNTAAAADQSKPAADLFCGVGTFASFLAELFPRIDLVEENNAALALARENLALVKNANFYAKRSEEWVKNAKPAMYGFMVADPPRQGFNAALSSRLATEGPPLLAYVSCDPATLARDSKILLSGQYELSKMQWFDFYPQTAHMECLAVFSKK